jgi:uncharacterized membrane protein (DUF485 family)
MSSFLAAPRNGMLGVPLTPTWLLVMFVLQGSQNMPQRNARLGLVLFFVYFVLYSGFVGIAAFAPGLMKRTPAAGVNLAVWYGFGLIAAAIVLALIYGWLCSREREPAPPAPGGKDAAQ